MKSEFLFFFGKLIEIKINSAAIGIVIGNSMVEIQNKDKGKESQQTFSIIPIVNYNFVGAYFTYRF